MAAAALRRRSTGAAVWLTATAGMRSLLSRARNSGCGSSPRRRSMSRCEYLGIVVASGGPCPPEAPHPRAKGVQPPQLELLDRAFAASDADGDVADAALFDEALHDDVALVRRQFVDEVLEPRVFLGTLQVRVRRRRVDRRLLRA